MLHSNSTLGGNTVPMCGMRKWGDFIWVPIYNEVDTVYMVFLTDTPLSCLHSTLSVAIRSDKMILMMVERTIHLLEMNTWKDISYSGMKEKAGKKWATVCVHHNVLKQWVVTYLFILLTPTRNISALLKASNFLTKRESWREKTEMGEALQGIELSDIPVKCTGIKPGVKPPLLFRLDTTKHRAIWQTVRELKTVCLLWLSYLYCFSWESSAALEEDSD